MVPADRGPRGATSALPPRHPGAAEEAFARVEAALGAGGTLVSDDRAPTFWVLADAEGNKACVTTWAGRAEGG
ncbi:VOC family protein [Nocardioides ungokensis]|uniref:VOC family protein n=1 Tax=Nocardioides ungokensis TaxID=1643322 RepID=UPI003CCD89AC